MALALQVEVRIGWVPNGSNPAMIGQYQANIAGQGQTNQPHEVFVAQVYQNSDFEPIPVAVGSEGSVTLANINTALTAAVTALAGASGTPKITPADLATIQGWASGNP